KRLMVEEACSGINSLFAMLACALFFVIWARRPVVRGTLLVLAAVGWVLLANIARVVIIAVAHTRFGWDLVAGGPPDLRGWGLFAITLLLIWSTDRLLMFFDPSGWFRRRDAFATPAAPTASAGRTTLPAFGTLSLVRWPVVAAFGTLAVA